MTGMKREVLITDIADTLVEIDLSGVPFKSYQPGVGPHGEPQLPAKVANQLDDLPKYDRGARTKWTPDLLLPGGAVEFKLARPFGDNGKQAEKWSANLLHSYEDNVHCYQRLTQVSSDFERRTQSGYGNRLRIRSSKDESHTPGPVFRSNRATRYAYQSWLAH